LPDELIAELDVYVISGGISALSPLNREIRRDMVTCSGCLLRLAIDNPGGVDVDIWKGRAVMKATCPPLAGEGF
jgi:hypothetical protein